MGIEDEIDSFELPEIFNKIEDALENAFSDVKEFFKELGESLGLDKIKHSIHKVRHAIHHWFKKHFGFGFYEHDHDDHHDCDHKHHHHDHDHDHEHDHHDHHHHDHDHDH